MVRVLGQETKPGTKVRTGVAGKPLRPEERQKVIDDEVKRRVDSMWRDLGL